MKNKTKAWHLLNFSQSESLPGENQTMSPFDSAFQNPGSGEGRPGEGRPGRGQLVEGRHAVLHPSARTSDRPLAGHKSDRRRRHARIASPFYANLEQEADQEQEDWKTRWLEQALEQLSQAEKIIQELQERVAFLEGLSMTDELTGLVNRRGFLCAYRRELAAARRSHSDHGVLVMIDMDGFKSINDTLGHAAGDAYLRAVGKVLTGLVREHDVVARLAGDEFAILLTGISPEIGALRCRQIGEAANLQTMVWNERTIPIRFSYGCCPYHANSREEEVMHQADLDLYHHKASRPSRASVVARSLLHVAA
jgi:diguanylate cyclase (GGDEF)-like protein